MPSDLDLFLMRVRPVCPKCKRADSVKAIAYGLLSEPPGPGVIAGGCILEDDSPEWHCVRCSTNFGRYGDSEPLQ